MQTPKRFLEGMKPINRFSNVWEPGRLDQNRIPFRCKIFASLSCFWLVLFLCSSCSSPSHSTAPSPLMAQSKGSEKSSEAVRSNNPLETKFFEGDPKGAEAWRQFINTGQYRLAQTQDFQFSDGAKLRLLHVFGDSWQSRVSNPYTGGEINHDKFYHDNAFIVIDKKRNDAKRFGLVIFNEQAGDSPHKPYWLYKERDLSKTVFGWASSGLELKEFMDTGESSVCYVNWNKTRQGYSCDNSPKQ